MTPDMAAPVAATFTTITITTTTNIIPITTTSTITTVAIQPISHNMTYTTTKPQLSTAAATAATLAITQTTCILQRHLLAIENLRKRVHQILKCVINLHIDILMLDSNVNQILDEVKELKDDLNECERLDDMIQTLRDYNGPTIYHEWPFPVVHPGDIEEADLAQSLNKNNENP